MMANPGFTFLQINICGLSDHSKIALNQYLQQTKADIVFLNETKTQISANLFDNYTTISSMGGNSGDVAVLLKHHIPFSRLNQLEDTSVDNVVLTVGLSGIKLIVSTAYVRPDDFEGLRSAIKVIQSCKTYVDKNCLNGALFFGDLNARHTYWGDKSCNLLGEELVQIADHFSILNDGEPTFLAANGYSVIDLCICYGPLFDRCIHSLSTDEFAELFTGAPQRGHVPVIMRLERSSTTEKTKKLWIEKADWVGWTSFVEGRIDDLMIVGDDPVFLWNELKNLLHEASLSHIPLKCVSDHSKPFWNSDLTDASNELRFLRKKFKYKSNFENGQKLKAAKERFKFLLNKSATEWMENYLSSLGHKIGREFWTSYKALLNTKHEEVGLIRSKEGRLLYAPEEISKEFETTFFGGEHLKQQIFNDAIQLQVQAKINQPHDGPEHDIELFHDEITFDEMKNAILKSSNTKSFDIDGLHLTMIKNLGTKALLFLLNIFNACWEYHVWPWTDSRVVFIRKPNKERYDECSSYRPLSISSHIGKTLERILATRIKSYIDVNGLLGDEQEGFRSKRNTTRSLYRLHLMLENAKRSRLPTALLNIDLEKAFDSVWVDGLLFKLLEHNISGKMYQIIKSFLKTRVASIELSGYKSPKFQIDIGVPQGSVLSPLLFIIFLNDFLTSSVIKLKLKNSSLQTIVLSLRLARIRQNYRPYFEKLVLTSRSGVQIGGC